MFGDNRHVTINTASTEMIDRLNVEGVFVMQINVHGHPNELNTLSLDLNRVLDLI